MAVGWTSKGGSKDGLPLLPQPPLSKNLSHCEHLLFQAKLALAASTKGLMLLLLPPSRSMLGKPSSTEVKPLGMALMACRSSSAKDKILSSKGSEQHEGAPAARKDVLPVEEQAFLKGDPKLVAIWISCSSARCSVRPPLPWTKPPSVGLEKCSPPWDWSHSCRKQWV